MNVLLQDRCLNYFSSTLAAHLLKGNIQKTPADSLIEAAKGFDLLSLASGVLRTSDMQKSFERDFETPDCQREKVCVTVERPGSLETLPDLDTLIVNTISVNGLVALPKIASHPKMKNVLTDCFRRIYVLIKSGPFKDWWEEMKKKQPQAVIIIFLRLDSIWCQIASIVLHSCNMKLIETNKADQIIKDSRLRAMVRTTFVFVQKVEDKILLKDIFTDVPRITPDNANPELQAAKVQKNTDTTSTVKSRANGNGNGGGAATKDTALNRNRQSNGGVVAADTPKKEAIEMGFLDPGQDCTLEKIFRKLKLTDTNTGLPCYDYHTKGRVCNRKNCKYLHGSFLKFTNEWQTTILQPMLDNKCARLNADLKNSKKHIEIVGDKYAALWDESFPSIHIPSNIFHMSYYVANDSFSSMLLDYTIESNSHVVNSVLEKSRSTTKPTEEKTEETQPDGRMDVKPLSFPKFRPKEVDEVLEAYQQEYAPNQAEHIVTSMQGGQTYHHQQMYPSRQQLYSTSEMKPRSTAQFRVLDLTLDEVILVLIHPSTQGFLCDDSWNALACLDKNYNLLLKESKWLKAIDFSEERHSHIVPLHDYLCRFRPACQHIPQGMNLNNGQQRLVLDGSTKIHPDDIVLNEFKTIDEEPLITFGQTKRKVLTYLWNTRISYKDKDILCAVADVKACF